VCVYVCGTRDGTQGLTYASQALSTTKLQSQLYVYFQSISTTLFFALTNKWSLHTENILTQRILQKYYLKREYILLSEVQYN
jgi:hypothetical protein